mmetsp:Transcript_32448/g.73257  ORF Transcript_32448/g.73257 Transcript_32448/m.73257 type:complete len:294 (+) Transcript_32448:310-1191(+)
MKRIHWCIQCSPTDHTPHNMHPTICTPTARRHTNTGHGIKTPQRHPQMMTLGSLSQSVHEKGQRRSGEGVRNGRCASARHISDEASDISEGPPAIESAIESVIVSSSQPKTSGLGLSHPATGLGLSQTATAPICLLLKPFEAPRVPDGAPDGSALWQYSLRVRFTSGSKSMSICPRSSNCTSPRVLLTPPLTSSTENSSMALLPKRSETRSHSPLLPSSFSLISSESSAFSMSCKSSTCPLGTLPARESLPPCGCTSCACTSSGTCPCPCPAACTFELNSSGDGEGASAAPGG